jgi:hypothetical protein
MPGLRKGLFRYLRNDEPARSMISLKSSERCSPCRLQSLTTESHGFRSDIVNGVLGEAMKAKGYL